MSDHGFIERRRGRVRVLVRSDLGRSLGDWLLAPNAAPPPEARPFGSGRGGASAFVLSDGRRVVWRTYRRGGVVGRVIRASYVGVRARPFRELAVTAQAAVRGVPCAEVLAARVVGRVLYRGAIITAEIEDARPVLDVLAATTDPETRAAVATAAGRAVGTAHACGLVHADLNCGNVLVRPRAGWEGWIVDLDRARLLPPPVGARLRARALARLMRSYAKLGGADLGVSASEKAAFRAGYEEAARVPCEC